MVIFLDEVLQFTAVVCVELTVCRVESGGPDSQLRPKDEMKETAGEECTFRDGWTQRWKAFSNCANFRPHMLLNLPKPVHSVSPLASIKPPFVCVLCVCVCERICVRIWECFSVCLNQPDCINKQLKGAKSFASITNPVSVLKLHSLSRSLLFQFPVR